MSADPADLANLHDIVLPHEVPWWPPAPGWIVLATILLATAIYYSILAFRRWKSDAYRRAALRELSGAASTEAVAEILRRTALVIAPRETVATLGGESWIDWLAARSPDPISQPVRDVLSLSLYDRDRSSMDLNALREFAARWITHHKRSC